MDKCRRTEGGIPRLAHSNEICFAGAHDAHGRYEFVALQWLFHCGIHLDPGPYSRVTDNIAIGMLSGVKKSFYMWFHDGILFSIYEVEC